MYHDVNTHKSLQIQTLYEKIIELKSIKKEYPVNQLAVVRR